MSYEQWPLDEITVVMRSRTDPAAALREVIGAYVDGATELGYAEDWDLEQLWTALRTLFPISIPVDRYEGVPDYDSFWDVPVSEVSEMESVTSAREGYAKNKEEERRYL